MKTVLRNIKGTKDILADETSAWLYLENYIHNFFKKFGYKEIRTPSFENTDLFLRSIGNDTDIVSKEMYSWVDQGNNNLTLRPELTAPVVRSFIQHQLGKQTKSHKLYYLGSLYRRERPQKGRFRQFKQFGIEAFGSEFPEQDAEIIYMAYQLYHSLNINDLELRINSIGSKESRLKYKKELQKYFLQYENQLTETSKKRLIQNPLRILDTKVDFEIEIIKNAPKIIDFLDDEDKAHFQQVLDILDSMKVPYVLDNYLVRGLDYYSRTVFEIQSNSIGAQSALCGGGRYDYLVEELGGESTPAIGFAAGFERLIMAMDIHQESIVETPDIYLIAIGDNAIKFCLNAANELRNEKGLIVITDTLQRSLKSQMKDANRLKVKFAIVIGDNELSSNKVSIKNMSTGEQKNIFIDDIVNYF